MEKNNYIVDLNKLKQTIGKPCPCLVPNNNYEPEHLCPCKEFINEGKCRCMLFIKKDE